jgi:uncharacterized protein
MIRLQKKQLKKWIGAIVSVYIIIGALIYFFQEKILFQDESLAFDHKYEISGSYQEINLPITNEKNLGIVQFTVPDSLRKGVVLYFHGNKRNIERYAPFAPLITDNHYEVWMIDYPGFGKSTGKRSEQILYTDAYELYKMARARFSEDSIILYGKSMGTGIAAQLASRTNSKRLILETPYYDFPSAASQYLPIYPMSWLIRYKLPTHEYLLRVKSPVTIIQGTSDGIIRHSNAKKLLKSLKTGDEFISIPGGSHNDLYDYPQAVQKLDSLLR